KSGITPRCFSQPAKQTIGESTQPHAELHACRHCKHVHHRRKHRHVHETRCVHDLPSRTKPWIDEKMVRRCHRYEKDIEHECPPAHLFIEHDSTDSQRAEHV